MSNVANSHLVSEIEKNRNMITEVENQEESWIWASEDPESGSAQVKGRR